MKKNLFLIMSWVLFALSGLFFALLMQRLFPITRPFSLDINAEEVRREIMSHSPLFLIGTEIVWIFLAILMWHRRSPVNTRRSFFFQFCSGFLLLLILERFLIHGYYDYYDNLIFWMDSPVYAIIVIICLSLAKISFNIFKRNNGAWLIGQKNEAIL